MVLVIILIHIITLTNLSILQLQQQRPIINQNKYVMSLLRRLST